MLILYVHAHMHVGTRVWLAPTCEWVWYTLGGREGKERSQRSGGHARRTVDRYSNGPFVPAQLARPASRIHSDNDDNDDNGDNDEYDERGVPSLSLFSSSHLPSWWLIQWSSRSRRFLLSFPVAVRCVWSRSSKIILDRSLLSKTGGSSFARFEGRLYLAEIFFREREIWSIQEYFDSEWSGVLGRVSKRFRLAAPELAVMPTMDGFEREKNGAKMWSDIFFCGDSRFAGNRVWKFVGETDRSVHCSFIPFFFFFVFFNLENNFVRVIEKWFYRERERKR